MSQEQAPKQKLMTIKFKEKVIYNGGGYAHQARTFEAGEEYDVTPDVAQKWVTRGKAEYVKTPDEPPLKGANPQAAAGPTLTGHLAERNENPATDEDLEDDEDEDDGPDAATTKNAKAIAGPDADKSHAKYGKTTKK